MARALYCLRQSTLMARARACLAPRPDPSMLSDIPPQHIGVFVVNLINLIYTERADPPAAESSASSI
jgi:hypothetical protein